jgi:membrane protease YdiL (CAAX protease family)
MPCRQMKFLQAKNRGARHRPKQIASWGHLAGFLLVAILIAAMGFRGQHAAGEDANERSQGELMRHSQALPFYLVAILLDGAVLLYCWAGVRRRGGNLAMLSGRPVNTWNDVIADLGITVPFWALSETAAHVVSRLLGSDAAKSIKSMLPQNPIEILLWIGVSITAGICEEMTFRGYLQQQLHALSGSLGAATVGQAVVFGAEHGYQGGKKAIEISVIGLLFGMLAAWRKNLRANMLAHTWSDIWGGWLSQGREKCEVKK